MIVEFKILHPGKFNILESFRYCLLEIDLEN